MASTRATDSIPAQEEDEEEEGNFFLVPTPDADLPLAGALTPDDPDAPDPPPTPLAAEVDATPDATPGAATNATTEVWRANPLAPPLKDEATDALADAVGNMNLLPEDVREGPDGSPVARSTHRRGTAVSPPVRGIGFGTSPNGNETYTSAASGITHDMSGSPPQACFNCGGDHWRANCPYGRS